MYKVKGTTITLTRGDTLPLHFELENEDGSVYIPTENDTIRFAMKKDYSDDEPLLVKNIPTDTLDLRIESADTKPLDFGDYVYDVEITLNDGTVFTFIEKAKLKLTEEVH